MSIEQILVLLLFVVVPLIQSLLKRRAEGPEELEPEPDDTRPPPPTFPRAPPPPAFPRAPSPSPPPVTRAPAPPSVQRETTPAAAVTSARLLPALGARERERSRHVRELLPRDLRGLRRAIVLAEVLGPPRCVTLGSPSAGVGPRRD